MSKKVRFIDNRKSLPARVAEFLISKGFEPGTHLETETERLSILQPLNSNAKPKKRLFGLLKEEPRRAAIGVIWFNNYPRHADEKNWVFEFWGNVYVDLVNQLANDLAAAFKVKITTHLMESSPKKPLSDAGLNWDGG